MLYAGYEKARGEGSLLVWDVERASQSDKNSPTQSLFPGETVTSIEPLSSPHTLLVATGGRNIRLVDHRAAQSASGTAALSWTTRAINGLTASGDYFASYEEGLAGIVKVFDLRFPTVSGAVTPLASQQGGSAGTEVASYTAGNGGVTRLAWRSCNQIQDSASTTREALGVGTKAGGVIIMDLTSMHHFDDRAGRSEELTVWTGFTASRRSQSLGDATWAFG